MKEARFLFLITAMGGTLGKPKSPRQVWIPETKLEAKMVEAMQRRASQGTAMKSFNSIILKFPKIDESLRNCKAIFEKFGKNSFLSISLLNELPILYLHRPLSYKMTEL